MQDRIRKTIPVNDDLSVICWEDPTPGEGSYISIKHNQPVRNMPGETMIAPGHVPSLIKALAEASLELTKSGMYLAGFKEGSEDKYQKLR